MNTSGSINFGRVHQVSGYEMPEDIKKHFSVQDMNVRDLFKQMESAQIKGENERDASGFDIVNIDDAKESKNHQFRRVRAELQQYENGLENANFKRKWGRTALRAGLYGTDIFVTNTMAGYLQIKLTGMAFNYLVNKVGRVGAYFLSGTLNLNQRMGSLANTMAGGFGLGYWTLGERAINSILPPLEESKEQQEKAKELEQIWKVGTASDFGYDLIKLEECNE